ncbi:MAG: hypothetical protein DRH93_21880 [Deltaproteobacteria bacterium]|nr:MAG: hypothetical protein DRH93_21880 [Deltaproteobacteria bacterium]
MEKILVSACLAGARVRYDGADNYCDNSTFLKWVSKGRIITICPEVASGCSVHALLSRLLEQIVVLEFSMELPG